ncbi:Hypothetical protein D9617_1g079560 [Elsinoe fawcettii]|nr:Hypothetical protein D9617_1g079560 [Elsinoe fawcettii]
MNTPHAKRRRLNESTSALHKPFRSPLKTTATTPGQGLKSKTPSRLGQPPSNVVDNSPVSHHTSSLAYGGHIHEGTPDSAPVHCSKAPGQEKDNDKRQAQSLRALDISRGDDKSGILKQSLTTEIPNSEDEASPLSLSSPISSVFPHTGPQEPAQTATPTSTDLSTAPTAAIKSPQKRSSSPLKPHPPQRSQTELKHQRQIVELRDQVALLQTHPAISSSAFNIKDKLEALIKTWTRVAQDAADILYPGVRERVEAAGGVKALSPKRGVSNTGFARDDDRLNELEEHIKIKEEELDRGIDAQGEYLRGVEKSQQRRDVNDMKDCLIAARSSSSGQQNGQSSANVEDEEGDREFTMGLMLKGMNIEHDLIGWDEEHDQWKDMG